MSSSSSVSLTDVWVFSVPVPFRCSLSWERAERSNTHHFSLFLFIRERISIYFRLSYVVDRLFLSLDQRSLFWFFPSRLVDPPKEISYDERVLSITKEPKNRFYGVDMRSTIFKRDPVDWVKAGVLNDRIWDVQSYYDAVISKEIRSGWKFLNNPLKMTECPSEYKGGRYGCFLELFNPKVNQPYKLSRWGKQFRDGVIVEQFPVQVSLHALERVQQRSKPQTIRPSLLPNEIDRGWLDYLMESEPSSEIPRGVALREGILIPFQNGAFVCCSGKIQCNSLSVFPKRMKKGIDDHLDISSWTFFTKTFLSCWELNNRQNEIVGCIKEENYESAYSLLLGV